MQRLKSIINQSKKSSVTGEHNVISTNAVFSNAVCTHTNDPYFGLGAPSGQDSKPKYAAKDEALQRPGLDVSIENLYYSRPRSWNETTFPNFQINTFCYSSYKITWQVDCIPIYMYVITSVLQKNVPSTVVIYYCAWYICFSAWQTLVVSFE